MDEHDRLLVLERDVAHIDKTLSEIKTDMKSGFSEMNKKIDSKFNITLGMFGGGVIALATLMYFLFTRIPVPPPSAPAAVPVSGSVPGPMSLPEAAIK